MSPSGSASPSYTPSTLSKGIRNSCPSPWLQTRSPPLWWGRCAPYSHCPTGFTRMNVFCSMVSFSIISFQTSEPTWWEKISLIHANLLLKLTRFDSLPPPEVWTLYPPILRLLMVVMILSRLSDNVLNLALLPVLLLFLLHFLHVLSPPVQLPISAGITVIRLKIAVLHAHGIRETNYPARSSCCSCWRF